MQAKNPKRYAITIAKIIFVLGVVFVGISFLAFLSANWPAGSGRHERAQFGQQIRIIGIVGSLAVTVGGVWLLSTMRKFEDARQPGDVTYIGCGLFMVISILLGYLVIKV